jgi:hypothetical protein
MPAPRLGASPATWLLVLLAAILLLSLSAAPARAGGVDDWVHTWEVVQYSQVRLTLPDPSTGELPTGAVVYYLGDSIARESTVSDEVWTRQLQTRAAAAGRRADAVAFTVASHNQTFGMDETIVEGLPATPAGGLRGIVLIGVGLSRFVGPPLSEPPARVAPPPAGALPELSPWVQHHYDDRPLLSVTRKKELVPRWMDRRWASFKRNRAANLAAIGRVIVACKAKGLRPVLLDLPLDLAVVGNGLERPRSSVSAGCRDLARRYHIRYLSFLRSIALPNTAYWDIHHLVKTGYVSWQSRLSDELVRLFPSASASATL